MSDVHGFELEPGFHSLKVGYKHHEAIAKALRNEEVFIP